MRRVKELGKHKARKLNARESFSTSNGTYVGGEKRKESTNPTDLHKSHS